MSSHKIATVHVDLVSAPVPSGIADATRKVETVGFAIVRITTNQGLEGFGITYHEVGGEAIKVVVETDVAPRLIGRDPFQTEAIWKDLTQYLRGIGRKGLTFAALSAMDIALWDLKGKIVDMPLYRLFGGDNPKVPIYASGGWTSYDDDQLVAEAQQMVSEGYTAIKLKVGVDGGANPNRDLTRVAKVRDAIGSDIRLMLDANNCWDAATAVLFANRLHEFDIVWLEEPVPADDIPGLARFKRGTDIPLATGEHEYTKYGLRDLLLAEAVDVVQLDIARAGGYTEMLKIAAMTEAWNLPFAPHAMEHMHAPLVASSVNGLTLERLYMFEELVQSVYVDAPKPQGGFLTLTEKPGLGLVLNEDFIEQFK